MQKCLNNNGIYPNSVSKRIKQFVSLRKYNLKTTNVVLRRDYQKLFCLQGREIYISHICERVKSHFVIILFYNVIQQNNSINLTVNLNVYGCDK